MVNPISYQPQQAFSGGADFSQLANLGNVYQKAQEQARQQAALGMLGQGQEADARTLLQSGVLPLAQLGLGMQDKSIERQRADEAAAQAQANFQAQQRIREAEAKRAQQTFDEDSPQGRAKKLVAAGLDPKDPIHQGYVATGQNPPDPIKQQAEKRAQTTFEQTQRAATPEGRRQLAIEGEMDLKDPGVRRWIVTGAEIPDPTVNTRLGIGAPLYTQNMETGEVVAHQLSATKPFETPPGHRLLGPGEVAQQKAAGAAEGKATAAAKVALPDVIRNTDNLVETLDTITKHPGKSMALGRGSHLPDWMVTGTDVGDFRVQVQRLAGEAMAQTMSSLKGAGLGSVSDFEQKTMMAAFVAASTAQTEKAFNEAMATARRSAEKIREIARAKAKGDFSERPTGAPAAASGGKPSLGSIFGQ